MIFGISGISVSRLFNLYDYILPAKGEFQNVVILYGSNGTGKTTILRLVFHLLSAAGNRGHRTALHSVPFKTLRVYLRNGLRVEAHRPGDVNSMPIVMTIRDGDRLLSRWDHYKTKGDRRSFDLDEVVELRHARRIGGLLAEAPDLHDANLIRLPSGSSIDPMNVEKTFALFRESVAEAHFMQHLQKANVSLYLMSADRELESDALSPRRPSDEGSYLRVVDHDEVDADIASTRDRYLSETLRNAHQWISQKTVAATNIGSQNANDWYLTLLKDLLEPMQGRDEKVNIAELETGLRNAEKKAKQLAAYELFTDFEAPEYINLAYLAQNRHMFATAERILSLFLNGVTARLKALDAIYTSISTLLNCVNSLFSQKRLEYTLTKGFHIKNSNNVELTPSQLSSGEKHLLLLLLRTLVTPEKETIFLIDEPEISLNIKWQRRLIDDLRKMIGNNQLQLILATHSVEILTKHTAGVAQLIPHEIQFTAEA